MKIATSCSTDRDVAVVASLYRQLTEKLGGTPDLLIVHCSIAYDVEQVIAMLHSCAPGVPLHGSTSCLGAMTEAGFHSEDGRGLGLLGLTDQGGTYGVGAVELGTDPAGAAQKALYRALEQADCPGETPAMIWMTAAPGNEESLIGALAEIVGDKVPIAGGSAADNSVSGEWSQFANGRVYNNAVVVTVMFPSGELFFTFHSGYEPTDMQGRVTAAHDRELLAIDGRPAAEVYDEWTAGLIGDALQNGGNILSRTSFHPLGRIAGEVGGVPYYQLSHPNEVTADATLTLFSAIAPGDEVILMQGTEESLISRVGRVASSTLSTYTTSAEDIAGALIIYCAGCILSIQDHRDEVVRGLREALPGIPFLGAFTFGEQGCFVGGENRHGNLMISVLLFSQ